MTKQAFGCYSKNPEPINTKFGTSDYVGNITLTPKLKAIAPVGASRQMAEIFRSSTELFWKLVDKSIVNSYLPTVLFDRCR